MNYDIELSAASRGYDGEYCWVQARAGMIPTHALPTDTGDPTIVLTMQPLALMGSDVFYAIHSTRSTDMGGTWTQPHKHDVFDRVPNSDGTESAVCDFTPTWHAATDTLLGTGHTAVYHEHSKLSRARPRQTPYAVYDPASNQWSPYRILAMPEDDLYHNCGAGCTQRIDLEGGDILLPMYARTSIDNYRLASLVARCSFDGETLTFVEHGNLLEHDVARGFGEPSLAQFDGRFFIALRNDVQGHLAVSRDGLNFDDPVPLTFDNGERIGNYNTQMHWVTRHDALYLVYTRRGLCNDHVFRHRAPLVMAQVDPDTLRVLRDTERVVAPERGARMGNFGVVEVSPDETWVIVAEWMQTTGPNPFDSRRCERFGSDNTVWAARIKWHSPNERFAC